MSADQPVTARMVRFDRFGGDDVLHVSRLGVSAPDALQVSVAVAAAGVNPVDVRIRSGRYPGVGEDRLPYTLGRDVAGVVVQRGDEPDICLIVRRGRLTGEKHGPRLRRQLGTKRGAGWQQ